MTVEVQPDGYKTVAVADCCAMCAYFGIQSRGYVCRRIMVRGYKRNEGHLRYATIEANGWCSQFLRQKKYTVAPVKAEK